VESIIQEIKGHAPSYLVAIPSQRLHNGPLEAQQISKSLAVVWLHWWNKNGAQWGGNRKKMIILIQGRYQINVSNGDASQNRVLTRGDDLQQMPI